MKSGFHIFLAFFLFFTACTKSPTDDQENAASGDSFLPLTTGSEWTYQDSASKLESKLVMTNNDYVFENYRLRVGMVQRNNGTNDSAFLGKVNHDYYLAGLIAAPNADGAILFHYLNDEKPVGSSWTYAGGRVNGFKTRFVNTIVAKDITKTVAGKTYANVIQTEMQLT